MINYDCPNSVEDYVHRIGRTGRAGSYGTSITFVTEKNDFDFSLDLIKLFNKANI